MAFFILLSVLLSVLLLHPTAATHSDDAIRSICNTTDYPEVCISTMKGVHWKTPPTPTLVLLQILHSEKLQVQRDAKTFYGLYKSHKELYKNPKKSLDVKRELIKCKKVYDRLPEDYAKVIREMEGKNFEINLMERLVKKFDECGGEHSLYGDWPWAAFNLRHKKLLFASMDVIDVFIDVPL